MEKKGQGGVCGEYLEIKKRRRQEVRNKLIRSDIHNSYLSSNVSRMKEGEKGIT